ncbi:MAG: 50S ribosomal protein L10 [Omnitrophica bacterium RBG_13_46_9]|nr:MAG: 50S ribosomal protein L10 [Omnitrophica bacterium RBG_13_46_9]
MEKKFGLSTKKYMFDELEKLFVSFPNFIVTNYKGLRSSEIETLRKTLNKLSSEYFVVKNSIAMRVLAQRKLEGLDQFMKGEVGIGFTNDIMSVSKTLVDFSKNNPLLRVSCACIDGKVEGSERIKYLAMLPPREVLIGMALGYMKSPITGFTGVLKNLLKNIVYVINEIKDKRGGK